MSGLPSVYLETTVISYLTARPSRNLRVVAHQEITADWWTRRRISFKLYVSRLVIDEAAAGDAEAAAQRLAALTGIPRLEVTESAAVLAARLVAEAAIPREATEDALHVAVAGSRDGLSPDLELSAHCERDDAKPHRGRVRRSGLRSAGDLHTGRAIGGLTWSRRMTTRAMRSLMKSSRLFVRSAGLTPRRSTSTFLASWPT